MLALVGVDRLVLRLDAPVEELDLEVDRSTPPLAAAAAPPPLRLTLEREEEPCEVVDRSSLRCRRSLLPCDATVGSSLVPPLVDRGGRRGLLDVESLLRLLEVRRSLVALRLFMCSLSDRDDCVGFDSSDIFLLFE